MKLDVAVNEVVLSNVGTTGEFRIRNSAKAFKILSDGLYSNKIRAIIRELSCNALDSHVGAGKADIPFEVHLPTLLEPWFSVRDFGLGLDGDQVVNIYTTYFESTKTDSNAFIGALGLGSKSPFSYTENFTVTAIKAGIKRIYSAFINEVGVPSIAEMSEELTDEGNGVEVKFSVTDRYDYQYFRNEASNVFKWFEKKPTIIGVDGFEHRSPEYKEMNIVPGVHVRSDSRSCIAVMGNIAYPLDNIPEAEKQFGELSNLLNCGLVLQFDIGELDFAASREQLSYIPLTINSIKNKLEALNANLATHLVAKIDAVDGEWAKALFLYNEVHSELYKAAVIKYVADTKFPLYDNKSYYGKKEFTYAVEDLTKRGLSISAFRYYGGVCGKVGENSSYVNGNYVKVRQIPVDAEVVIVLNDLKTGCQSRAQYHYSKNNGGKRVLVFCVSHTSADLTERQTEYDKLIAELHNPPIVVKASALTAKERSKSNVSTIGIATLELKESRRHGYDDSYKWVPYHEKLDENETYYYVCLSNHDPIDQDGKAFNMLQIKSLMAQSGTDDIANIRVFGVRKNRIKEIAEYENWVWIEDKIKEEVSKISDAHIASLIASDMLDSYYNRVYTSKSVAKSVGPDSDYAKYVTFVSGIKRASGSVTHLVQLCKLYGNTLKVEEVKKKIEDAKAMLHAKYPLIKYFKDCSDEPSKNKELADYIKLVDKQEKVNE